MDQQPPSWPHNPHVTSQQPPVYASASKASRPHANPWTGIGWILLIALIIGIIAGISHASKSTCPAGYAPTATGNACVYTG